MRNPRKVMLERRDVAVREAVSGMMKHLQLETRYCPALADVIVKVTRRLQPAK